MSTISEIERAIEKLPAEQWAEIRRWMDSHIPKGGQGSPAADLANFDTWLADSTGLANGLLITDERMRETRGED